MHVDLHGLRELRERLANMPHVKVGLLASRGALAQNLDGTTMLEIGAIHEYGAPRAGIPERSWLRSTFTGDRLAALKEKIRKLAKLIIKGEARPAVVQFAHEILGQWAAEQVKQNIRTGPPIPPPLSPITIARKGSDRPLVDTGRLVNTISYEVSKYGE